MSKPPFLHVTWAAGSAFALAHGPGAGPADTSLEEERRELLDSVLDALSGNPPDPDQVAACHHLLKCLAENSGVRGPCGGDAA